MVRKLNYFLFGLFICLALMGSGGSLAFFGWAPDGSGNWLQQASGGNLLFNGAATGLIAQNTSDAADSRSIDIAGGGATGSTRGATIQIYGNEHAGAPGEIRLSTGAINTAALNLYTSNSNTNAFIGFNPGNNLKWKVDGPTGQLMSDATNGGGIVIAKTGNTLAVDSGTAASACKGTGTHNGTTAVTITTTCAATGSIPFFVDTSEPTASSGCWVTNIVNGTSFDVDCKSVSQDATFAWWILKEG